MYTLQYCTRLISSVLYYALTLSASYGCTSLECWTPLLGVGGASMRYMPSLCGPASSTGAVGTPLVFTSTTILVLKLGGLGGSRGGKCTSSYGSGTLCRTLVLLLCLSVVESVVDVSFESLSKVSTRVLATMS